MKKKIIINQFHSGSAVGDAVTNSLFYTQKILQNLGFESHIYCEHIAKGLEDKIQHYSKLQSCAENVLLIHHSMGHDLDEWIEMLKDRIILVYHNITPPEFFPKESLFYHYAIKGREQLQLFQKKAIGAIAVSQLNKEELLKEGFTQEKLFTIPLLIEYEKIATAPFDHAVFDHNSKYFNILFVGRIAPNKAQLEIVKTFELLLKMSELDLKLTLVGNDSDPYAKELREYVQNQDLQTYVEITGKVSDEALYAYYKSSHIFLCLSEHEGFGVPLIESMIFDLPVLAYESSNIANTLDGAGVLFQEKNLEYIAAFMKILLENRTLRRKILLQQQKNIQKYRVENIEAQLIEALNAFGIAVSQKKKKKKIKPAKKYTYQIEGPFDSSYSLALLNREMARAIEELKPQSVALYSTEGGGDFSPKSAFLAKQPFFKKLYERGEKAKSLPVVLRNLYPPRVYDAKGLINLMNSYGWEESAFVQSYLDNFNLHLDGVPVMSEYVKELLINNGLAIPAKVVGVGVDHVLRVEAKPVKLQTTKSYKFLHISSCFARKGIEELFDAYEKAFSSKDDVVLIIKTFVNPHNKVEEFLHQKQQNNPHFPEVEIINKDLAEGAIVWLYKECDALVAPSKGEGFGLPMAEAMLFDMPVITTGYSGQMDFCTPESAWLIDFVFEKAQSHMQLFNSYWAKPLSDDLARIMKTVKESPKEAITQKCTFAKENILKNFTWRATASRMLEAIEDVASAPVFDTRKIKIGWLSSWNSKCGIATYSDFLLQNLDEDAFEITILANRIDPDEIIDQNKEKNVLRIWNNAGDQTLDAIYTTALEKKLDVLFLQFNFGFFNLNAMAELIEKSLKKNIQIFITFHSVKDVNKKDFQASLATISKSLAKATTLFVHTIEDLNILKNFGLINNVRLFPHGVTKRAFSTEQSNKVRQELGLSTKQIIASYGFMLPHKGIKELVEAFYAIKQKHKEIHLLLINAIYPDPISQDYATEVKELIKQYNLQKDVTLIDQFLSDETSFHYLECSDLLVMPYKETQESASGAVRYAIATNKPVLCTPISIFDDVSDIVHFSRSQSVEDLREKIESLLEDKTLLQSKADIQKKWIDEHEWKRLSKRVANIIKQRSKPKI